MSMFLAKDFRVAFSNGGDGMVALAVKSMFTAAWERTDVAELGSGL